MGPGVKQDLDPALCGIVCLRFVGVWAERRSVGGAGEQVMLMVFAWSTMFITSVGPLQSCPSVLTVIMCHELLSGCQKGIEVEGARRDAESSDVGALGHGSGRLPACPLLPGVCACCGIFCPYTCMLMSVISVLLRQEPATWGGLDLGSAGVWVGDYGWGVRVRRPFAHFSFYK